MLYLSRLLLNQACRSVRSDISDCRQMHRTVMRAFPGSLDVDTGARASMGVLYRVEHSRLVNAPRLLVQSRVEPDWSKLPQGYLLDTEPDLDNPACKNIEAAYAQFAEGDVLVFCLMANPTRKTNTSLKTEREAGSAKRNGNRVFIGDENEQLKWLARKAEESGFELLTAAIAQTEIADVQISNEQKVSGKKRLSDTQSPTQELVLRGCTFSGRLRVVDSLRFRSALVNGIGSGKAYGFGLLSVARPRA